MRNGPGDFREPEHRGTASDISRQASASVAEMKDSGQARQARGFTKSRDRSHAFARFAGVIASITVIDPALVIAFAFRGGAEFSLWYKSWRVTPDS